MLFQDYLKQLNEDPAFRGVFEQNTSPVNEANVKFKLDGSPFKIKNERDLSIYFTADNSLPYDYKKNRGEVKLLPTAKLVQALADMQVPSDPKAYSKFINDCVNGDIDLFTIRIKGDYELQPEMSEDSFLYNFKVSDKDVKKVYDDYKKILNVEIKKGLIEDALEAGQNLDTWTIFGKFFSRDLKSYYAKVNDYLDNLEGALLIKSSELKDVLSVYDPDFDHSGGEFRLSLNLDKLSKFTKLSTETQNKIKDLVQNFYEDNYDVLDAKFKWINDGEAEYLDDVDVDVKEYCSQLKKIAGVSINPRDLTYALRTSPVFDEISKAAEEYAE